ncbi:GNAT family acetyltransferase acetyltransferase [Fusarium heterosporum]|uniref:GNAT family acetyltransferase acetyltransferase n=1 Tax=Fusarium heterosporum TaxID=42747 RepID=A0A8H5WUL2_FUSHE|nr:GNAT family acetyltransferase acetyltransferase [Fusarium heterosporum]
MPFKLVKVNTATDFEELIACQWAAHENPFQPFFRMFCPLQGEGPSAHADSLRESTKLQLQWHNGDPTSHWRKVVNDDGKIVGGCLWKICPTNPFESVEDHSCAYWQPEGERREYISQALKQFDAPRARMGTRPQVYVNIVFTHPEYRRQGVANEIMNWSKKKADEMGVELWLDATEQGMPVYEKHGFTVVNVNTLRPMKENPGEEWNKVKEELGTMTFRQMWRPAGSDYQEGKTVKPWEVAEIVPGSEPASSKTCTI